MRVAAALLLCSACSAAVPIREVISECPEPPHQPVCKFRQGYALKFDSTYNRVPLVYAPDGRFLFPLPLQLPGAEISYASDIAPDSDGSFVVAAIGGAADMRHQQGAGLAMFDAHGIQTAFVDTGKFWPGHVAISPDHSIWVLGAQFGSDRKEEQVYDILHKYSRSGVLQGTFLPRSSFPPGLPPGAASIVGGIMAAADRIVAVVMSGANSSLREVVEFDSSGKILGRMRFDKMRYDLYAFTSTGAFYAGPLGPSPTILELDAVKGSTREVTSPDKPWLLVGSDGSNLIFRSIMPDGRIKIAWFSPPGE